jgi:hypothetical protein
MSDKRQMIPIAGLLATAAVAIYMVVQLSAQTASQVTGNFTNATRAEVRDAQGQVVLEGQFVAVGEDDDDVERKAALKPTAAGADAGGEAEVEFEKSGAVTQEVEFSARGLQPGATFTFVIDGQDVATATADQRGRAEVELEVSMPGASGTK